MIFSSYTCIFGKTGSYSKDHMIKTLAHSSQKYLTLTAKITNDLAYNFFFFCIPFPSLKSLLGSKKNYVNNNTRCLTLVISLDTKCTHIRCYFSCCRNPFLRFVFALSGVGNLVTDARKVYNRLH